MIPSQIHYNFQRVFYGLRHLVLRLRYDTIISYLRWGHSSEILTWMVCIWHLEPINDFTAAFYAQFIFRKTRKADEPNSGLQFLWSKNNLHEPVKICGKIGQHFITLWSMVPCFCGLVPVFHVSKSRYSRFVKLCTRCSCLAAYPFIIYLFYL